MKNKYGVGFFMAAIIAVITISGAYELSYQRAKEKSAALEKAQVEARQKEEETQRKEASVRTEGEALKEDCFYLMEVNGYVVVYYSDKKTPYEYTDILYDELPETLREEIRNGKYVEDAETLYGFLENYSS